MARRTFGATWWGAAWLDALEQRALVDPNRLPRGRTYARQDRVTEVELSPGLVQAKVWGTDRYVTQMSVRVLDDATWDLVIDTIMERAANAAALLSGEVPQSIGDLVLPGRGDLGPDCTCPDWAEPCKHAAALCYVLADVFDADPFALLALRGRSREEVLVEVRRRRAAALGRDEVEATGHPRGADPGIAATASFKRTPSPNGSPIPAPRHPAVARVMATPPPADSGIDAIAMRALVDDAADRAWRMLAQGADSGLSTSAGDDVVRRAGRVSASERDRIADHTGLDRSELEAAAAAWRIGGRAGYRASRDRWTPPEAALAAAAELIGEGARIRANRVSDGPLQLRLDESLSWWRFGADDNLGWVLVAGPAADPADLLEPADAHDVADRATAVESDEDS